MALNAVIGVIGVALLSLTEHTWDAGIAEFGWLTAMTGFASLAAPAVILVVQRLAPSTIAQLLVVLPLAAVALAPTWTLGALPWCCSGPA